MLVCASAITLAGCSAGPTVTEERDVNGVESVSMSGIGRLEIEQGPSESLEVEGPERIVEALKTRMEGSELRIEYDAGFLSGLWGTGREPVIRLTVEDLSRVDLSGAGSIEVDSLTTDSFELEVSGAGNAAIDDLQATRLKCTLSGAGNFEVSGQVFEQNVDLSGAGSFQAADLRSSRADIEVSGAGSAKLWVTQELDLRLSGAGDIEYWGNPRVNQDVSGAGSIESLGSK